MSEQTIILAGNISEFGVALMKYFLSKNNKIIIWSSTNLENELTCLSHNDVSFQIFDTADSEQIKSNLIAHIQRGEQVDVLINFMYPDLNSSKELDLNNSLTSAFNMIKVIAPQMVKQKNGRIVNISPIATLDYTRGLNMFESTKSGLESLTSVWARELGKHGITVNSIYTAFIEAENEILNKESKKNYQQYIENIPVGRMGSVSELCQAIGFLISNQSGFINGISIRLDGGYFC